MLFAGTIALPLGVSPWLPLPNRTAFMDSVASLLAEMHAPRPLCFSPASDIDVMAFMFGLWIAALGADIYRLVLAALPAVIGIVTRMLDAMLRVVHLGIVALIITAIHLASGFFMPLIVD